ncbi:MAG: enoyl-ACP reductase [Pirellulaceae bacterium]|nr:enoyl-ACP reductase [Pirellulaceae bacterium]
MNRLFEGKRGLILGVANDRSIAWAVAKEIMDQGGVCGFSHLPDKPDDPRKKNRLRVSKCVDHYPQHATFLEPLDVQSDEQVAQFMQLAGERLGHIDFLLHSIAFADRDDLARDTVHTSRQGFKLAMDVSVYSLIAVTQAAQVLMKPQTSVLTMTYFGGEKCVPGYNVMGICKAALDATVRYLAFDLGLRGQRVNAVSAGPLKTLAGTAAGVGEMQRYYDYVAPLGRCVTHDEVGRAGAYLLSDYSGGITGEILHVDSGYNIMGSPGRLLETLKDAATTA